MVEQKVYCTDCKIRIQKSFLGVLQGTEYETGWKCEVCSIKHSKK
jgi:hypothetical protein